MCIRDRDRLIKDFKVKASTGKIEISYREALTSASTINEETYSREVAGKLATATAHAEVMPLEHGDVPTSDPKHAQVIRLQDNNVLIINHPTLHRTGKPISDSPALPPTLALPTIIQALTTGTSAALARGPAHALPLHSTLIQLHFNPTTSLHPSSTPSAISSAARLAVTAATKAAAASSETALMEPVMLATIAVNEDTLGAVVHDLSSARGATVLSLDAEADAEADASTDAGATTVATSDARLSAAQLSRVYAPPDPYGDADASLGGAGGDGANVLRHIRARVPLKEMVGYLKHLRSLTGGRGTFVMSVDRYEKVGSQRLKAIVAEMRGGFV